MQYMLEMVMKIDILNISPPNIFRNKINTLVAVKHLYQVKGKFSITFYEGKNCQGNL
jgi:hypothetical protein